MTDKATETTQIDETEFTAAYGTAVTISRLLPRMPEVTQRHCANDVSMQAGDEIKRKAA